MNGASYGMTRAEMTVRAALGALPKNCRYHGENIEGRDLWRYAGACCATGQPSLMRRRAEASLTVLGDAARQSSADLPVPLGNPRSQP